MQAMDTHARSQTSSEHPSEYSRLRPRHLEAAARLLPGRVRTMMHLTWLSRDPRARALADTWHSLTAVEKVEVHIEKLCHAAGISDADFIGCVSGAAWELGIDIAALFAALLTQRWDMPSH
jgi:hypothetical protein